MNRPMYALLLAAVLVVPASAQQKTTSREAIAQQENANLDEAQLTLRAAEQAGAPAFAKTLYDEAAWRLRFAQENWNAAKTASKDQARMRSLEALWAGRAALGKARWIGTNEAIRSLQGDITRLGGRSGIALVDEAPNLEIVRGNTSKERVAFAQTVLDAAKAAGVPATSDDMKTAQERLAAAKSVTRAGNSETADYLSYTAEMMARRALYTTRFAAANRNLEPLQLQRTQLAQAESARLAAEERAQREEAQKQAAALQAQLAQEQANRQAQSAELDRLRQQVEANRLAVEQRLDQDRTARVAAEQRLDEAVAKYQTALVGGSPTEVETLRRQVEDQQIALRTVQERERMNEQSMSSEIDRLRGELQSTQKQGSVDTQLLAQRQADILKRQEELDQLRKEREAEYSRRDALAKQQQDAIAEAQKRRQEAEAQSQALQAQVQQATQAVAVAQQQAQTTKVELERTRQELAARDAEARWLRTQQEIGKLAASRTEQRGFIVTLPGIFFDSGKSVLKAGAENTLSKIAAQLKDSATAKIAVEGHTDNVGSESTNLALSERRAQAVRDYLVNAGIPADRVTSSGKGEAQPIATNKTVAGRQQNRRVELVITNG